MAKAIDLARVIQDNPGCHAQIDNDFWVLYREDPANNPYDWDERTKDAERWDKDNELVTSDDRLVRLGDGGYGSGNCHGGDILQALAQIVGIKVESV